MPNQTTYNDIYLDLFENYDVGLVEILGPTGNGKTSALYQDFNNEDRFILNEIAKAKRQAIFMTDRKNIVKEVARACEKQHIKHVYYRANHEIIKKIVLRKKGISTLLSQVGELGLFSHMRFHTERSLRELFHEVQRLAQTQWNYKEVNEICSEILRAFREAISKKVKSLQKKSPKRKKLLTSPAVWELFPFIEFSQDTSKVVLIGTTNKLGYPMFDGENHRSIYELKGYYLFIDEFDRQVDAFLDHLIDDKKNLHPEIFVSHFCEHYAGKSGESETTQNGITIAEEFHKSMSEMGLQFPRGKTDNYKFSNADHLFKRNEQDEQPFGYIFDSGYTVSSAMYYLRDHFSTPYEGELVFTKDSRYASFIEFYETIRRFEIKIFNFFADLKKGQKVKEDAYRNLLRLIYDIKNDEEITAYHKFIDQNSPAFRPRAFEFLREILEPVEQHYLSKKSETPEELLAEWDLPANLKQIPLQDEQQVPVDWHNSLVIYRGGSSATLALPNLNDLPTTHWTIYLLAFKHSLTISSSQGCRLNAYTKFINDYTLNKGEVVQIRKHLQQQNTFQILKRFPILRRLNCDDSFFTRGYAYNQIIDRHSPDSENRVDVNHYSLKMTPEARLFMLAARNLVFGISATSDIQQNYAHFSLPWVRTALTVFSQSQQVQPKRLRVCIPDTGSRSKYDQIIASMLQTKEKTRQTQLSGHVRNACGLNEQDEWAARILRGLEELRGNGVDLYGDKKVSEGKKDRRLSRVSYHFEAFRWILEESQNDTHLIFTDTFSNTLKIFQYTVAHAEGSDECPTGFTAFLTCVQSKDKQAIEIEPVKSSDDLQSSNAIETVFIFKLNRLEQNNPQKSAYIIFANAATWGKIYDDDKKFYNEIFNRGRKKSRKVIVITQQASASNGVNLQYELNITREDGTEIVERDFESFYMSHPLYYFFASNDDDDKEPRKHRRETAEDIRNKEKSLYKASKFKVNHVIGISHLKKFMGGSSELNFEYLNGVYRKTEDYRKYMITLLTQEIGRVERTRDKAKPTEVTLPENMCRIIERADFPDANGSMLSRTLFENRQSRMSPLLKAIINDIRETAAEKHSRNEDEYESIGKMTVRYKERMKKLIEVEFNQLRKGLLSEKNAKSLRQLWEEMRDAALKGDFHFQWHRYFEFEFMEHCVFNTSHVSPNENGEAQIFIRREHGNEDILPEWQAGVYIYQPNKIYDVVRDNVVIGNHFANKGFKDRFDFTYQEDNFVFIPEFQKAILQGAIGEEALKALLREAGIEIESNDNIPDELFELVDFKIKDLPIYVDAKHWKDQIIEDFANEDGEAVSQKLTHEQYMEKGRNTLSAIQRVTGVSHAKVVYINLLFSEGKGYVQKTGYRNQDCTKPVATWEDAYFVYIAGALSRQNKNKQHDIFDHFLNDVLQELERLENLDSSEKDDDRLSENLITNQVSSTNLVVGNNSTEKDDYASTQNQTNSVHHQYHLFDFKEKSS
jgi:hypothetical protein